jgi:hypothetical protein
MWFDDQMERRVHADQLRQMLSGPNPCERLRRVAVATSLTCLSPLAIAGCSGSDFDRAVAADRAAYARKLEAPPTRDELIHAIVARASHFIAALGATGLRPDDFLPLDQGNALLGPAEELEFPLHRAALHADPATVQALLDLGFDPNERRGAEGQTPLHYLVGFWSECEAQLDRIEGDDGRWLARGATFTADECEAKARLLIEAGTDLNLPDRDCSTIGAWLVDTRYGNRPDFVEQLRPLAEARGASTNEQRFAVRDVPLLEAVTRGDVRAAESALDAGACLHGDNAPLLTAIRLGHVEVVSLLLARGADPNRGQVGALNAVDAMAAGSADIQRLRALVTEYGAIDVIARNEAMEARAAEARRREEARAEQVRRQLAVAREAASRQAATQQGASTASGEPTSNGGASVSTQESGCESRARYCHDFAKSTGQKTYSCVDESCNIRWYRISD